MTTDLAKALHPATPDEAARMTASWPDLLHSQIQTDTQANQIRMDIKRLTVPATKQWISGRVATLLSQYFVSSVPTEMMAAIAEDWHAEVGKYPAWALQRAVRWWMGEDNPDRRKKPMPGDIAARARLEVGVLKVAQGALGRFERGTAPMGREDRPEPATAEQAKAIMQSAGYAPKKFKGE